MIVYFKLIIPLVLIIISYIISNTEKTDTNNPFGSDTIKNKKYSKKSGDEYGVNTYWGKPSVKDNERKIIDKIQWLSHSYENDTIWRRSIIFATIGAITSVISIDPKFLLDPTHVMCIFLMMYIISYMSISYYTRHYLWRRSKFIDIHITKLKKKLGVSLYNSITVNPLI
jgi:hypothetical protein